MIADGILKKDGVIDYVTRVKIDIPGFKNTVDGARESVIKILNSVKNDG
jgi:hypothetical protein